MLAVAWLVDIVLESAGSYSWLSAMVGILSVVFIRLVYSLDVEDIVESCSGSPKEKWDRG